MMYITLVNKRDVCVSRTWHVGTSFPFACPEIEQADVFTIQADGDELDYILTQFNNIPTTKRRVQTWTSDFARFIGANLALQN